MKCLLWQRCEQRAAAGALRLVLGALVLCGATYAGAQDTPLLSGGYGFFTTTNGGNTTYAPTAEPLLAVPVGHKFLIESRAVLTEDFFPQGNGQGYGHSHFVSLTYLQGDYLANKHLTVVGGSFLTPFGTYNERLSPIWITDFQDGPLIAGIGAFGTGTGLGGELRGSVLSRHKVSVDYVGYFSARSGNMQFNAGRSAGGRVDVYFPEQRLEIGASYARSLQGVRENFGGAHLWWEPAKVAFKFRSEFATGEHADGYWFETSYRAQSFGGLDSWIGRIEPVFRMQQTFRRDEASSDTLPSANTQRADFGLDYNLPHNTRIVTSYSRQFTPAGGVNIWETGIVYRLLLPTWKGR